MKPQPALQPAPVMFVSHGAPTLVLEGGPAADQLARLGRLLDDAAAVLVLSPHWRTPNLQLATAQAPGTLHDFSGFPRDLYRLNYPAPGAPDWAEAVRGLLPEVIFNEQQPWDHGVWSPLMLMRPQADVPVLQLSMPYGLNRAGAYALGQALAPLTQQGVAILGSGSLTHNLYEVEFGSTQAAPVAQAFEAWVRERVVTHTGIELLLAGDHPHFAQCHPTDEHFLPLLFAWGAAQAASAVQVFDSPILHRVLSMESYAWNF